jgi:phage/plasmid-associated DNA primase
MSNFINTHVVLADDMPSNLAGVLDRDNFLRMASGGTISAPIKNQKSAYTFESFKQPMVLCGNVNPNYSDENGEIIRRLFIMKFDNIVSQDIADTDMLDKMKESELGSIIHTCRNLYLNFKKQHSGKRLYDIVSDTFKEFSQEVREEINISYGFASECLVQSDGHNISRRDMLHEFREYVKARFGSQAVRRNKLNDSEIKRMGFDYCSVNTCRSCGKKHEIACCENYDRMNKTCSRRFLDVAFKRDVENYTYTFGGGDV